MTRQHSRNGVAAARQLSTRHRTLAATAGRAPKKTAAARVVVRTTSKAPSAAPSPAALEQQLAEARLRILELEARLNGVTDRVAWIADQLHGLLDGQN